MTQQVVNALTLGSVIALFALGYSMVYGILTILNFAHGEVFMIGAFMGYYTQKLFIVDDQLTANPILIILLSLLVAMVVCGALAVTIEFVAYRPLRQAARLAIDQRLGHVGSAAQHHGCHHLPRVRPISTESASPQRWALHIGDTTVAASRYVIIGGDRDLADCTRGIHGTHQSREGHARMRTGHEAASFMGISVNGIISLTFWWVR